MISPPLPFRVGGYVRVLCADMLVPERLRCAGVWGKPA